MSDAEQRPPNRRHITTACMPCRDSKIKCDGKRPVCGICSGKGRDCWYDSGIDKRRISLRKVIQVFTRRVVQLETCLRSKGIEVPEPALDDGVMLQYVAESYKPLVVPILETANLDVADESLLTMPNEGIITAPASESDITVISNTMTSTATEPSHFESHQGNSLNLDVTGTIPEPFQEPPSHWRADAEFVWYMSTLPSLSMDVQDVMSVPIFDSIDESPGEVHADQPVSEPHGVITVAGEDSDTDEEQEDTAKVTHQFSDRLGTLLQMPNGEWRFYGATSNLHLVHGCFGDIILPRRSPIDFQACLELAGVGHFVSDELTRHLINLYFTWQNPSLYVVDQEAFQKARNESLSGTESGFYSELLVNSICAIGAAFDNTKHPDLPTPMTNFFANRARSLLDLELDNPRVSTVQALAILSTHEGATTRDTRGWLYSGMAVRLAFDLGLHIDPTPYVVSGKMSMEEARVRNSTFWGTFATDRMWGFNLGRPFHNSLENVTLSRPSENTFRSSDGIREIWLPHGTPSSEQNASPNPQDLVSARLVALYEIMSDLGCKMYCKTNINKIELQSLAERTFEELCVWKSCLPVELIVDTENMAVGIYLPHTLILHMQYALCIMILHRPFVAKDYIQPHPLVGKGPEHARMMCVQSAIDIAKLIREYGSRYSLRRANILLVHMAFNAALILVYATLSEMNRRDPTQLSSYLDTCSHALAELGHVYESASRTLDILLSVKRMWQARLIGSLASVQSKRPWRGKAGSGPKRQCST